MGQGDRVETRKRDWMKVGGGAKGCWGGEKDGCGGANRRRQKRLAIDEELNGN